MELSLKNENIPGYEGGSLNVYQVRDYLVMQPDPKAVFDRMVKKGAIDELLKKAVIKEMQRIGFRLE